MSHPSSTPPSHPPAATPSRDEALETMLLALCLDAGADAAFRADPVAFARSFGVDERDARSLATDGRRLGIYRRLVRNAVAGTTRTVLAHVVARLDALAPGLFDACLDDYLAPGAGPRTPVLREVPRAFFDAARARLAGDARVPPWLVEAAEVILTEHDVGAAPDVPDEGGPLAELALDRPLLFAPGVALRRYAYAVPEHDLDSAGPPAASAATWLAVRDREHAVGWRELTPPAAAFLTHALAGATLADAMSAALASPGSTAEAIHPELTQLLADLAAEGVLLGARG